MIGEANHDLLNSYLDASRFSEGIYVVGVTQTGVTVYNQQVRSLNLTYVLTQNNLINAANPKIAIIGGGIAGITAASSFILKHPSCEVSLFEQHADLCPLQQGSDSRWLHPNIYEWPDFGSRQPTATLPFLTWREGRASDVASQILKQFAKLYEDVGSQRMEVFLDVKELKISDPRKISWVGYETEASKGFFQKKRSLGESKSFDLIVITTGFGRENSGPYGVKRLYWQNDDLSKPRITNEARTYIISGAGDGALVDLLRLTVERFRQDRIVYEIFGAQPEQLEAELRKALQARQVKKTYWMIFQDLLAGARLESALELLRVRLRKDTRVILHLAGPKGECRSLESALEQKSSVLNKLLVFLLYRCGAFIPSFALLDEVAGNYRPSDEDIICRHGTKPIDVLKNIFHDPLPEPTLKRLIDGTQQSNILWPAGWFPTFPGAKL